MTTTQRLIDNETGDVLGVATTEQIEASDLAATKDGGSGIISINDTGDVVQPGTWDYDNRPTRKVWVCE